MAGLGQDRIERRLAAILAADVAGYSRLTGLDEEGTHAGCRPLRALVDPKIPNTAAGSSRPPATGCWPSSQRRGRVRCAVEVQRGMAERNRRGARREAHRVPHRHQCRRHHHRRWRHLRRRRQRRGAAGGHRRAGRHLRVRARARQTCEGKLDIAFEDMGEQQLKNIARPVRVYRVRLGGRAARTAERTRCRFPTSRRSRSCRSRT